MQQEGIEDLAALSVSKFDLVQAFVAAIVECASTCVPGGLRAAVFDEEGGFKGKLPYDVRLLHSHIHTFTHSHILTHSHIHTFTILTQAAILEFTKNQPVRLFSGSKEPLADLKDIKDMSVGLDCIMSWSKKDQNT